MSDKEMDGDSDAPEEFTTHQGMQQDEELSKVQLENKARVIRERKERCKQRAQKLTPHLLPKKGSPKKIKQKLKHTKTPRSLKECCQMTLSNYLQLTKKKSSHRTLRMILYTKTNLEKRKPTKSGLGPVILKDIPTFHCVQNSLDFLKKRKMQVARSSAVLNNSYQALRLVSKTGLL